MEEEKKVQPDQVLQKFNDELLQGPPKEVDPKRNTKEFIIDKILQVADTANLELQVSNTKLKRMNKDALNKLLAELMEAASRESMARAVGAKGTDDKSIGIASLRMVHDMVAMATENGLNTVLPDYGYHVNGFVRGLKEPQTSQCIDECLKEIAATTDVLQYIESPYARLAIAWGGSLVTSIRPNRLRPPPANIQNINNQRLNKSRPAPHLGPKPTYPTKTF